MLSRMARWFASLWVTLVCLVGAALLLMWSLATGETVGWDIAVPFGGLGLNLLAALVVTPSLRRQPGLLAFHLGLGLLALIAALGRLASLSGHIEVTEGLPLEPAAVVVQAGPLHDFSLPAAAFVQGPFTVDYLPGMRRTATRSQIFLANGSTAVVGDDTAAVITGYRLYTSHNKGLAPSVSFRGVAGWESVALHLPSYPLNDFQQGTEWQPPGLSAPLTVWLHLPTPLLNAEDRWTFIKPAESVLVVDDGVTRQELRPGEQARLAGGVIRYNELRTWMGYSIDYDPSRPWLLAAGLVAIAGLIWHGMAKIRSIAALAEQRLPLNRNRPA